MEENTNELSLEQLVDSTLDIETNFDYSDVSKEEADALKRFKARKQIIALWTFEEIGGDLVQAQSIYANKKNGKFKQWVEEEYKMNYQTAKKYIGAYEVWVDSDNKDISTLGVHKLSYLHKLDKNERNVLIENAPLNDMNVKQVAELTTKVKEAEEYSDELVEEIRKKDQKIRENRDSVEQKDKEIQELKSKIQELENGNVQPVAEVQEKIVEKVVEKEVVPKEIQEKIEKLEQENNILKKDNDDKAQFIKKQNGTIVDQRQKITNLQIDDEVPQESLPTIKLGSLLSFIDTFLRDTSGFTLLKGQFSAMPKKSKETLLDSIGRVEDWCLLMKQAVNNDRNMVGNNIIIESEED